MLGKKSFIVNDELVYSKHENSIMYMQASQSCVSIGRV